MEPTQIMWASKNEYPAPLYSDVLDAASLFGKGNISAFTGKTNLILSLTLTILSYKLRELEKHRISKENLAAVIQTPSPRTVGVERDIDRAPSRAAPWGGVSVRDFISLFWGLGSFFAEIMFVDLTTFLWAKSNTEYSIPPPKDWRFWPQILTPASVLKIPPWCWGVKPTNENVLLNNNPLNENVLWSLKWGGVLI